MPDEQSYLSYFTPSQMSHEMLESILVKRQKLAARLVEKMKQSALTETKHQTLLLGPRGMGKSYLVALVYHRVKALPELVDKAAIAYFAEEEWSVASLTDLLLVILKALEREYGGLQAKIDALYRRPVREIEGAAGELVRKFVGERTLLILVENLDEIFRGLGSEGQWAFRAYLSERPFASILATTPSLFAGVSEQESAFYGYFRNIYLEELAVEEATELLEKVAERRDDEALANFLKTLTARDRVQAVHDLAGGHPRIYLLFAHLLTQETLDELVTPFLKLLDELTPYYQSRMQLLSPQQRKIVEFLCSARGAVAVKEIANQNLMTSQTASSQLDKLEEMAYVRKTSVSRDSLYELREPLLRMVIEVKRGRGEPVRLIVDFLRRWYNRHERQDRLSFASPKHPLTREYLTASLDLERAVQDAPDLERARQFSIEYARWIEANQFDRACEIAAEIIERKGTACDVDDWFQYAYCLSMTMDYQKALTIWDKLVNHDPKNGNAWNNRGNVLGILNDHLAALGCYDKALAVDTHNVYAWEGRAIALGNLGDYSAALASCDRALVLDPHNQTAWRNRNVTLYRWGDYPRALTWYDVLVAREPNEALYQFNRAEVQLALGQWDQFLESIERGFSLNSARDKCSEVTKQYCRRLLDSKDFQDIIAPLVRVYAKNFVLGSLGQGVTESIPTVVDTGLSQITADEWLATWQAARGEGTELEIPLRLLTASVEWKRTRSIRALLSLPIEERRILESLLPGADVAAA